MRFVKRWRICRVITVFLIGTLVSPVLAGTRKITVMPIGDSITSALRYDSGYRYWLWRMLVSAGIDGKVDFVGSLCGVGDNPVPPDCGDPAYPQSDWDWDHEGRASTATSQLVNNIQYILGQNVPDITLLHYGTNDFMIYGQPPQAPVNNIARAIDSLRAHNPRITVLLAQIIPYIGFMCDSVPVFNQKLSLMAAAKSTPASPVIIVDHYTGYDPYFLNGMDKVHPRDNGYQFMADRWYPALVAALQSAERLSASLSSPLNGTVVTAGDPVELRATATAGTGIKRVDFYANGTLLGTGTPENDSVFALNSWRPAQTGCFTIKAAAIDNRDSTVFSNTADLTVNPAPIFQLAIGQIQDTASLSSYTGKRVATSGIVTVVAKDSSIFWIQASADKNPKTPEGIGIERPALFPYHPRTGDSIRVRGVVKELKTVSSLSMTTMLADSIVLASSGNSLPPALNLSYFPQNGSAFPDMRAVMRQCEGMLVRVVNGQVIAPSTDSGNFAILPPGNRVSWLSPLSIPPVQPDPVSLVTYLPAIIPVTPVSLATPPTVRPGDIVNKCVGVVAYDTALSHYCIAPISDSLVVTSQGPLPAYPVSRRSSTYAGSLRITTFDAGGLFDTIDAAGKADILFTGGQYSLFIETLKKAMVSELLLPGIVCVQGVENQAILADLASRVNSGSHRGYKAVSYESTDPSGLENGFLYDTLSVAFERATLLPAGISGERQSLVASFIISWQRILLANVDFADRMGDDKLFGKNWPPLRPSEAMRCTQAGVVRRWIDSTLAAGRDSLMIVAGRFNSYSFVEPGSNGNSATGIVRGDTPAGKIRFTNLEDYLFSSFSDIQENRAGMFTHILLSPAMMRLAKGVDILHYNAGWPASLENDSSTTIRAGASDPVEVRF